MSKFDNKDFVCKHLLLRKETLIKIIRENNLTTMDEIQDETNAATICGACYADIEEILEEELNKNKGSKIRNEEEFKDRTEEEEDEFGDEFDNNFEEELEEEYDNDIMDDQGDDNDE